MALIGRAVLLMLRLGSIRRGMPANHDDLSGHYMDLALRLARRARGRTSPNPMVGAALVSNGEVVGMGWHKGPGTPHAERVALQMAGDRAAGSTLYLTLEPCTHQGRTPPCAEAVIEAGISLVVVATEDPDRRVAGRGVRALEDAGIPVERGVRDDEARKLNEAYFTHRLLGRPFVTYKAASSLDGRTAARDGTSKWITGEAARQDVQRMRAQSDAICVGIGTVLIDDPSLTARRVRVKPPVRVVADSSARTPIDAAVLEGEPAPLVFTTAGADSGLVEALRTAGAEVVEAGGGPRVSIGHMLETLAARGILSLLLEGGETLAGAFAEAELIDRYVFYVAPKLLGGDGTPGILAGWSAKSIGDAVPLEIRSIKRVGEDVRIEAEPRGRGSGVHRVD